MRRIVFALSVACALLMALVFLSLAITLLGRPPAATLEAMLSGAFGSTYGWSETLLRTVPVLLCALAAAVPAGTGQVNIGGEGQFHLGAIGAVLIPATLAGSNSLLTNIGMVLAAICLGAIWASLPAVLRAKFGLSEALVSLFLNYVATYLLQYLVHGPMQEPSSNGWPMSPPLAEALTMERWGNTRLHFGIVVAVVLALMTIAFVGLTRKGTELRAVGLGPKTSATVGIPVTRFLIGSMLVGGAFAGLAGYYEIAAVQHRLRTDISLGFGYSGFLVAWICRGHLWLIIPTSILVAGLIVGAESAQITNGLPAASGDLVQGFLLLFVLLGAPVVAALQRRRAVKLIMESAS